jgi:hypothetical protein
MATSEDELQTMAHRLNLIPRKYKMNIPNSKTKSMAMCGNHIQGVKIVINGNPIEQVSEFKYLGYLISDYKSDLEDKIQTYNKINGVILRHFGKQMTKETKLRTHNITANAALKFSSEAWVLKKRDEQRLEAVQMKFLKHLLGITELDRERNQSVREKLGVQNTVLETKRYQREWLQHVQRMDTDRVPKQSLKYRPKGKRSIGRPRKRWKDQLHLQG